MKYFIITGASKGLGEGIALELLHEDHHLLCVSRNESQELKTMATAKNCQVDFFAFDLAFNQDIPRLCQLIFEKIDTAAATGIYLINNAGVIKPVDRVENCPPEEVETHLRVNLIAPMVLTIELMKRIRDLPIQKRILNISSGAATNPYYGWSSYCTGKAGLDMFSRCVATEQQDEKYPVESMGVAPGIIDTGMQTTIRGTSEEQFIHRKKFVELKETGQLIPPTLAGKRLASLLLSSDFKNGGIIDIRESY